MPGRSEIAPALSRLCLTAVTSSDPLAGAGAVGGTVDAWGFGWLPDGTGAGFPVARGITFLSWAGTSGDPGALDSAHFRHHDDISAELFATPFEDGHKAEVWAATLQTIGLARRLRPRLEEDALIVCAGGDAWCGELIAGLLPEARVVTILGATGSKDIVDLAHVDFWLPFGRRCANHDIAVIDDVSDLAFAHGQALAACLFDGRVDTHAWAALCAEGGVLCAAGADAPDTAACERWALEEMVEDALPGPGDSDPAAARLLISQGTASTRRACPVPAQGRFRSASRYR